MKPDDRLIGFEPFNIGPETRFLILGSFPSVKSLAGSFYYLHPRNRFYRIIAELFGKPFPETVEDKKKLLIDCHIGLWDIVDSCVRPGSLDSAIKDAVISDLRIIPGIEKIRLGCSGRKSFQLTSHHYPELNPYYLPSPSPANAKYFSIEPWREFLLR